MLIPFWCLRIAIIQNSIYGHCMVKWLSHIWHIHDGQVTSLCISLQCTFSSSKKKKKNFFQNQFFRTNVPEYVPFRTHRHISAIFSHEIWTTAISYYLFLFWVGRWPDLSYLVSVSLYHDYNDYNYGNNM